MDNKLPKTLSGVAGEYFVAAELSRKGYIASLTLKNTKGIDLLVSNQDGTKSIGIQVKTNQGTEKSWVLSQKNEEYNSQNLIYIFVNCLNEKIPNFYIVKSNDVAEYIKENHQKWFNSPNKKGGEHIETNIRKFNDIDEKYKDNWEIIKTILNH